MIAAVLASDWCQKTCVFLAPIRSEIGDRLELVWQDIVPRSSFRRSLLFFVPYFSARLDFPSPPLSAPGSPRMKGAKKEKTHYKNNVCIYVHMRTFPYNISQNLIAWLYMPSLENTHHYLRLTPVKTLS